MQQHSEIGSRLIVLRKYLKLSSTQFCNDNGFSQSQYSNWESGYRRISLDASIKLTERYGLTLDFIYRGVFSSLPYALAHALAEIEV